MDNNFHRMGCEERYQRALKDWESSLYRTKEPPARELIERIHDVEIEVALVEGWDIPPPVILEHHKIFSRYARKTLFDKAER